MSKGIGFIAAVVILASAFIGGFYTAGNYDLTLPWQRGEITRAQETVVIEDAGCDREHVAPFAVGELLETVTDGNWAWVEYPVANWVKITPFYNEQGWGKYEVSWWDDDGGHQGIQIYYSYFGGWVIDLVAEYDAYGQIGRLVNVLNFPAGDEGTHDWVGMEWYVRAGELVVVKDGALVYSIKFPAIEYVGFGEISVQLPFERYEVVVA